MAIQKPKPLKPRFLIWPELAFKARNIEQTVRDILEFQIKKKSLDELLEKKVITEKQEQGKLEILHQLIEVFLQEVY